MIPNSWLSIRGAMMLLALFFTLPVQAAFTVNSDGTVVDSATGLMWDQCSWGQSGATCATGTSSSHTWSQALGVAVTANSASYKGHTDWRLPNINEMESLVDLSYTSPAIDSAAFPNTEIGVFSLGYWTSTPYLGDAWNVVFFNGSILNTQKTFDSFVRLVRNGPSFNSFDTLAPWSPFNVVAVMGNASAKVNFSVPGGGGAVVSGYTVRAYPVARAGVRQFQSAAGTGSVGTDIDAGSLSLNHTITGLANGTAYTFTVTAHGTEGDGPESVPSDPITPSADAAPSSRLINLSTRGQVQAGNNVMIGGFIIQGNTPKRVLIRAVGPNLSNYGVTGVLLDPTMQLYSGQTVIASNDNWGGAPNVAEIQASGLAPSNALESAILTTLSPGAYTAIVSGSGGGTGVGIVEVYELDHPEVPLINISTRGQVLTGDNVMIGGFIIQGTTAQAVLIRAVGPNLVNYGVTGVLANPMLQLYSGQTIIASNDNWQDATNASAIQATGLAPVNSLEAAILITLPPGAYTAIVSGAGGGTGVGIIEVFTQ